MGLAGVRLLLIDGPNLVRRIHAAVPGGDLDGTLSSVRQSLQRALDEHHPTHVIAAFESAPPTWRHILYSDYKKDRPPPTSELRELFSRVPEVFEDSGVHCVTLPGMEADDVIASTARRAAAQGAQVRVLSTDTGQAQLLGPGIRQFDHFQHREITAEMIRQRFGVDPVQLPDFLALAGDSGHSLPGVPGIGAKTAARLLTTHADLETAITGATGADRMAGLLREHAESARLGRRLAVLRDDVELGLPLSHFRYHRPDATC